MSDDHNPPPRLTVAEVVPSADVPIAVRALAEPGLAKHGYVWSDVGYVARLVPDSDGYDDWIVAIEADRAEVGATLRTTSGWASRTVQFGHRSKDSKRLGLYLMGSVVGEP
jgi:hypothetical protein